MPNIITFKTKISFENFKKFQYACAFGKNVKWTWGFIGTIYIYLISIALLDGDYTSAVIYTAMPTTLIIMILKGIARRTKKSYESDKTLQEECEYAISEEGILLNSKSAKIKLDWNYISSIKKEENLILIFISTTKAYLIAKESLKKDQEKEIREIFEKHLPPEKLQWPLV